MISKQKFAKKLNTKTSPVSISSRCTSLTQHFGERIITGESALGKHVYIIHEQRLILSVTLVKPRLSGKVFITFRYCL